MASKGVWSRVLSGLFIVSRNENTNFMIFNLESGSIAVEQIVRGRSSIIPVVRVFSSCNTLVNLKAEAGSKNKKR